jgi:hypothetical protein
MEDHLVNEVFDATTDDFFKSFVVHDSKSVDDRKDRENECCDHGSWNEIVKNGH